MLLWETGATTCNEVSCPRPKQIFQHYKLMVTEWKDHLRKRYKGAILGLPPSLGAFGIRVKKGREGSREDRGKRSETCSI